MRGVMRRPVVVLALLAVLLAPAVVLPRTVARADEPALSLLRCDEVGMTLRGEGFAPGEDVELFVIPDIPNPNDAAPLGAARVADDGSFEFDTNDFPCPHTDDTGITVAARIASGLVRVPAPAVTGHGSASTSDRYGSIALVVAALVVLGGARRLLRPQRLS